MPRPAPNHLDRSALAFEILRLLELAGDRGMTRPELLTEIGPDRTSLPTIQRAIDDLRSDDFEVHLVYDAKTRRWRLEAPVALPLDAPQPKDVVAAHIACAILEPLVDAETFERITRIVEGLDERARSRTSPKNLLARKTVTATLTLGTRINHAVFTDILDACRRRSILIKHASPWHAYTPVAEMKWQEFEPWSVRVHDGAAYVRGWSPLLQGVRTFRLADIVELKEHDSPPTAPRQQPPADPWRHQNPAFGIDYDRPDTAVIRLRGAVARWVHRIIWHPSESDVWIEDGEILERTVSYRSCREMARRLASILDGLESIEPAELHDELVALVSNVSRLKPPTRV